MSNIGRQFASEMERYIDKKSGREVVQLTKSGSNWHLYFTDNSFTTGDEEIIYLHSDYTLREKANTEVFRMNLNSGVRTQVTDFHSRFETGGLILQKVRTVNFLSLSATAIYTAESAHGRDNAVVPLSSWLCAGTSAHEL